METSSRKSRGTVLLKLKYRLVIEVLMSGSISKGSLERVHMFVTAIVLLPENLRAHLQLSV
jgi:hypothetical protein